MSNLKDIQQIQSLIAKGKGMGYLTFDEVNKALPVEMNTPEQFEEIIGIFEQLEIAIVDSEKDGKKISATPTETDDDAMDGSLELTEDEESADYSSRSTDPVRMYLREMGAVPLLDRDGEVVIAKKIEMGEQDVLYALVEVPVAVEELINVGEDLRQNRIKLKDVEAGLASMEDFVAQLTPEELEDFLAGKPPQDKEEHEEREERQDDESFEE